MLENKISLKQRKLTNEETQRFHEEKSKDQKIRFSQKFNIFSIYIYERNN